MMVFNLSTSAYSFTVLLNNDYTYLPIKVNHNVSRELLSDFLDMTQVFRYSFFNLNRLCERFLNNYFQSC